MLEGGKAITTQFPLKPPCRPCSLLGLLALCVVGRCNYSPEPDQQRT